MLCDTIYHDLGSALRNVLLGNSWGAIILAEPENFCCHHLEDPVRDLVAIHELKVRDLDQVVVDINMKIVALGVLEIDANNTAIACPDDLDVL